MQAILWTAYGPPDVLELHPVPTPAPADDEVLIKIHAATVTAGDCELRALQLPLLYGLPLRLYAGWRAPSRIRILGQELAGEIQAVGKAVTAFRTGDAVLAAAGFRFGANAEYICLSQNAVMAHKPANVTYPQAAAVPVAGLEALHFMRHTGVQRGDRVWINGAGGSIGTFAVQLAKRAGAHVTASDRAEKLEMLRALGADRVLDYTRRNERQDGATYDVIFDVMGKAPFAASVRQLAPNGRFLVGNAGLSQWVGGAWTNLTSRKKVLMGSATQSARDLSLLCELLAAGELHTVIDRTYPLAQTAEAHRYVESGQKKGHVVLTVYLSNSSPTRGWRAARDASTNSA